MATITPRKPVADVKKHVFDNSQRHVFSAKAGQLLPILSLETIPNSDYEIDVQDLLRTLPLNQAAYIRAKQHVDFFFVPYSQLFTKFNQFFAQRHDPVVAGSQLPLYMPNFNLFKLVLSVASTPDDNTSYADMFDFSYKYQVGKLLDLLGYGAVPMEKPLTSTSEVGTVLTSEWYQWIKAFFNLTDAEMTSLLYTTAEGALLPDWFSNCIDYSEEHPYMVSPFRAAAYNKIWNDFYRNPYRDDSLDPIYYNFDDVTCTTVHNSSIDETEGREYTQFTDMFNMRYRRWKNDIFTASFPSAQFGNASFVTIGGDIQDFQLYNPKFGLGTGDNFIETIGQTSGGQSTYSRSLDLLASSPSTFGKSLTEIYGNATLSDNTSLGFSVAELRMAIAMQHWAENVIRAGNRTNDNFRAHFGVTPNYENEMHVKFLGSYEGSIDLNVVSTSATGVDASGNTKVNGSLTSNGISSLRGNKINYHSNDFGIIMAIFSILPEAEYNATMIDKNNTKLLPFDFPNPELDDIGFQPINTSDLGRVGLSGNIPVGYVFPYYEYKTAIDKVHGNFLNYRYYSTIAGLTDEYLSFKGNMASFVSPRWQLQAELMNDAKVLYVNPRVYDDVFGVSADSKETSDQFQVNMFFDVKSRLPLSVLGLPQY